MKKSLSKFLFAIYVTILGLHTKKNICRLTISWKRCFTIPFDIRVKLRFSKVTTYFDVISKYFIVVIFSQPLILKSPLHRLSVQLKILFRVEFCVYLCSFKWALTCCNLKSFITHKSRFRSASPETHWFWVHEHMERNTI